MITNDHCHWLQKISRVVFMFFSIFMVENFFQFHLFFQIALVPISKASKIKETDENNVKNSYELYMNKIISNKKITL